jgi:Protein of unknown function (DUF3592)
MPVFLLDLKNADFAEGKGPYRVDSGRGMAFSATVTRIALILGAAMTLAAGTVYFYQANAKDRLPASVRTVTATVTGCEGPGRFQNIRFHYTVDGKTYDQSAYMRQSQFLGPAGLIDSCAGGNTVQLSYLGADPDRWSIAPLSPLTREELESRPSPFYLVTGGTLLLIAGIFALATWKLKSRKARQEKLGARGVLLKAQLVRAREDNCEDTSYNIRCDYRFLNPLGRELSGTSSGYRRGMKKKNLPPAGTEMLVLYVDDNLFEAL